MRHTFFDRLRVNANVGDYHPVGEEPDMDTAEQAPSDTEADFGGREARLNLERKLLRKLDLRMSILVLIYILNYVRFSTIIGYRALSSPLIGRQEQYFVSRVMCSPQLQPIGFSSAARLEGFEADLHLKGQEFNTLLSILYAGYIFMQIPS
jgi:hypothetical protein